ncbi:MAG: hypothetical protein GX621_00235 [Pirellulaceae bacterium]|nr:hypothetical protein [Pirellulaceae bacterium]
MRIRAPELITDGEELRIQAPVEYAGRQTRLWFSMNRRYLPYVTTEKCDGFLVGLLLLAMRLGEDIHLDAPVSAKLFYNLRNHYMRVLRILIPSLRSVAIVPTTFDTGDSYECRDEVVTGFSAGVDSFCVLADHYFGSPPPGFKVTRLVFNNVGSHGEYDPGPARILFNQRYDLLRGYPSELGLDFVKIDSNLLDLLQMEFVQTHLPRNVAAVMMLQKLFGRYLYASAHPYEDCRVAESKNMATTDPVSVHLLSTETLECMSTGCQYSRVEKTRKVAEIDGARRYLNVCTRAVARGKNCSTCRKCRRTLLALEMLGEIEKFRDVFDLAAWKRARGRFIVSLLGNHADDFRREIVEHANSHGFRFDWPHRLAGHGYAVGRAVASRLSSAVPARLRRRPRR